jgi:hypothetical protein
MKQESYTLEVAQDKLVKRQLKGLYLLFSANSSRY